jgi:hypothetical protein
MLNENKVKLVQKIQEYEKAGYMCKNVPFAAYVVGYDFFDFKIMYRRE